MPLEHRTFSSECVTLEPGCTVKYWNGTQWLNGDEYGIGGKFSDGTYCYTVANGIIISKVPCIIDVYVNLCAETDGDGFVRVKIQLQNSNDFIYGNYIDASVSIEVDFTVIGDQSNYINTTLTIPVNDFDVQNEYQLFFVGENISSVNINSIIHTTPVGQNIYVGSAEICGGTPVAQDVYLKICYKVSGGGFFGKPNLSKRLTISAHISDSFASSNVPVAAPLQINYTVYYADLSTFTPTEPVVMLANTFEVVIDDFDPVIVFDDFGNPIKEYFTGKFISNVVINSIVPGSAYGQNFIVGSYNEFCCDSAPITQYYANICVTQSPSSIDKWITVGIQEGTSLSSPLISLVTYYIKFIVYFSDSTFQEIPEYPTYFIQSPANGLGPRYFYIKAPGYDQPSGPADITNVSISIIKATLAEGNCLNQCVSGSVNMNCGGNLPAPGLNNE